MFLVCSFVDAFMLTDTAFWDVTGGTGTTRLVRADLDFLVLPPMLATEVARLCPKDLPLCYIWDTNYIRQKIVATNYVIDRNMDSGLGSYLSISMSSCSSLHIHLNICCTILSSWGSWIAPLTGVHNRYISSCMILKHERQAAMRFAVDKLLNWLSIWLW